MLNIGEDMVDQDEKKAKLKKGREKKKKDRVAGAESGEQTPEEEPFGEVVKFIITQPTNMEKFIEFEKGARQCKDIQVKLIAGSVEQGNYFIVAPRKGVNLTDVLTAMPSVQQVVEIQGILAVSLMQSQPTG